MGYSVTPPPNGEKDWRTVPKSYYVRPVSASDANPSLRQFVRIMGISCVAGVFACVLPAAGSGFVIGFVNAMTDAGIPSPTRGVLVWSGATTAAITTYLFTKRQLMAIAKDQRDAENVKLTFGRDGKVPEERVTRYLK